MSLTGVFLKAHALNFIEYNPGREDKEREQSGKEVELTVQFFAVTTTCVHKYFTSAAFRLVNLTAVLMQPASL